MIIESINYTRTLDYYEGIQLFEARDDLGGSYVASLVETGQVSDKYLVVGCPPESLRKFMVGNIDLRELLQGSATYGWCLADVLGFDEPIKLDSPKREEIPDNYLPKSGLFTAGAEIDHEVTRRAREQGYVVIQVAIDPPETRGEHRVRANTLSRLIRLFQTLAQSAVTQAIHESEYQGSQRQKLRAAHQLDAVGLSEGSIAITFQGASKLDGDGILIVSKALQQLDELCEKIVTPEEAKVAFENCDPKLADAYLKVMKFLSDVDTSLSYTWATPDSKRPSHQSVSINRARMLTTDSSLTLHDEGMNDVQGELVVEGVLEMADEPRRRWRIRDHNGQVTAGTVQKGNQLLSQLVIGESYRFTCSADLQPTPGAGWRSKRVLTLQDVISPK